MLHTNEVHITRMFHVLLLFMHVIHSCYSSCTLSCGQKEFLPIISIINSGQVAPDAQFVGVQYVPDTEIICIAVSTGEVVTFSVVTNEVCERGMGGI